MTVITSTDTGVTILDEVLPKNMASFKISQNGIEFTTPTGTFSDFYSKITVNNVQLTKANAKGLLSDALFRNASGSDGSGAGGDSNNWNQTDF
jgi:hypothetical protein